MRRLVIAVLTATALIALGCGAPSPDDQAPLPDITTNTPAPKGKPKPAPAGIGEGTHEVGSDIKPGKYKTVAPKSDSVLDGCYWARLKNLDGDIGAILANGNLKPGAKGALTVKKSDAAVEFSGPCVWVAVK